MLPAQQLLQSQPWQCSHVSIHNFNFNSNACAGMQMHMTCGLHCRYVYDGEFEGQMSMLHAHPSKQLMQVSDIYPAQADLKKGDHVVRLQLRHHNAALLNKMNDIPVVIEMKLKEPVTLSVYANNRDAIKGEKAVDKDRTLHPGDACHAAHQGTCCHRDLSPTCMSTLVLSTDSQTDRHSSRRL